MKTSNTEHITGKIVALSVKFVGGSSSISSSRKKKVLKQ
jgi:hypothetical protein